MNRDDFVTSVILIVLVVVIGAAWLTKTNLQRECLSQFFAMLFIFGVFAYVVGGLWGLW